MMRRLVFAIFCFLVTSQAYADSAGVRKRLTGHWGMTHAGVAAILADGRTPNITCALGGERRFFSDDGETMTIQSGADGDTLSLPVVGLASPHIPHPHILIVQNSSRGLEPIALIPSDDGERYWHVFVDEGGKPTGRTPREWRRCPQLIG